MQITKRRAIAIAAGLLLATTCFAAQPALAQQQGRTGSVTSKEIKNNSVLLKDLNTSVRDKIKLGTTALQSIADASITSTQLADDSVTNPKLADNAVGSAEITDDSVGAADLGPNSVNSAELANNSVDTGAVADGSLLTADISAAHGIAVLDFPNLNAGACAVLPVQTGGNVLNGDLILLTAPPTVAGIISFEGRQQAVDGSVIAVLACNHAVVALNPASAPFAWAVLEN
jgi:hypothetical protein